MAHCGSQRSPAPLPLPAIDLHIHTRYSADVMNVYRSSHTPIEVAKVAREKALEAVGITDHCDYVGPGFIRRQNRLVDEAQVRHGIKVLSGLEVSVVNTDGADALSVDAEIAAQVDYVIGSVHGFPGATMHWANEARMHAYVESVGVTNLVRAWTDLVLAAMARGGLDILGHPVEMFRKFGLLKTGKSPAATIQGSKRLGGVLQSPRQNMAWSLK